MSSNSRACPAVALASVASDAVLLNPPPTTVLSGLASWARTHWVMMWPVETDSPANWTPSESMKRSATRWIPTSGRSS